MNCQEVLDFLDSLEPGAEPSSECLEHAASCPTCAFALRLEATLRSAPGWSEKLQLKPESRARVLAGAKVGRIFWRRTVAMLEEAAVTAFVLLILAAAGFVLLPGLVKAMLPQSVRAVLAPYLEPLAGPMKNLLATFSPLLHEPWGFALIVATAFVVLLAAVMSTLMLRPRTQL
jgi:hypothetical protein